MPERLPFFLTAALDEIADAYALAYIKKARALRRVYLMTRAGEHIDSQLVEIYLLMTDSLNGIGEEKNLLFFCYFCYFGDRHNGTYLVVCIHYGNERRIVAYRVAHCFGRNHAVLVDIKICHLKTLFFQCLHRVENGVMLDLCRYQVLALSYIGICRSSYCPVIGFRAA